MAFRIVRNDITKVSCDAIVNTANPLPIVGTGTDTAVYEAAGKEALIDARREIGVIESGCSRWTPSFDLKANNIKYIIHTVGTPYKNGGQEKIEILRNCYKSALSLALELKCKSVAIPLLATGNYHFPKDLALQIAVDEISQFLMDNNIEIVLVVYDDESYKISEKLFDDIENYLGENYVKEKPAKNKTKKSKTKDFVYENASVLNYCDSVMEMAPVFGVRKKESSSRTLSKKEIRQIDVDAFISQIDDELNFQNTLQKKIADKNLDNASVYSKAFIDRKFFSKIISNKDYIPKKQTVMALGLALELPIEEYEDFLASAGYAFMPSSKFDLVIKYCVLNQIYNIIQVDILLNDHGLECFATE